MTLLVLAAVLLSLTTTTVNAASFASPAASTPDASPTVGATTHPIQYAIAGPPSMIDAGSLAYFKAHGFSTVELIAPDSGTYQTELNEINALGMKPVIDVENVIWRGGQIQSPITSFGPYFQSLKNAGWEYVASEGGRPGDLTYMKQFFNGYVNYNCNLCGLWLDVYTNPFTVMNSWESYYSQEWPSIQQGATQAAARGIQNGIMAGLWANSGGDNPILANSLGGGSPSYKSMLDWSYANGIGFTQFCVWCSLDSNALNVYIQLGFPQIVANLQAEYPAISSAQTSTSAQTSSGLPTHLSLSPSSATAAAGQPTTFSGTLTQASTPLESAKVDLQVSTDKTHWELASNTPAITNAKGAYAFSESFPAGTYYFRTTYAGSGTYAKATSNVVAVIVKVPTALSAAALATATVSKTFTVRGKLTVNTPTNHGGIGNAVLTLLMYNATSKTYSSVKTVKTTNTAAALGAYTFSVKETKVGTYYYKVSYAGTATYEPKTTGPVKVIVT